MSLSSGKILQRAPRDYWRDKSNQRAYIKTLEKNLNILKWEDWYQFTRQEIVNAGGVHLLKNYENSFSKMILEMYPQHSWDVLRFKRVPMNYWQDKANQKAFMKILERKLNVQEREEWYHITQKEIIDAGGEYLLRLYGGSPSKLILEMYPDHSWDLLRFTKVPQSHWRNESNRKEFMKVLERRLNIVEWEDWYKISQHEIINAGGQYLLRFYGGSPSKLILEMYPEHSWDILRFKKAPQGYWTKETNQKDFMKIIEDKMNVQEWEDWYHITQKEIVLAGGEYLLKQYENSPAKLIMNMYPQHSWNIFEFRSNISWNAQLIQNFLLQVSQTLQIASKDSWRTLSSVQLKGFKGGSSLLKHAGSLYESLKIAYPTSSWDFMRNVKISRPQNSILEILRKYITRDKIYVNHRHSSLIHKSGVKAELDIWIPSMNIAIEYHGEHHYHQLWERSDHPNTRTTRDSEKRSLCIEEGIDLIEIPYWWDKSERQLIGLIRGSKMDFLVDVPKLAGIAPIRQALIRKHEKIAKDVHYGVDYSAIDSEFLGWHTSEKLDGIRIHWDGTNAFSRGGNSIGLLEPLSVGLSDNMIEGEFWYGRGLRFGQGSSMQPYMMPFDAFYYSVIDSNCDPSDEPSAVR